MLKRTLLAVTVAGALTAASALAASPKPAAVYRGTGKDFMNNAPRWTDEGTGKISFKTSGNGAAVVNFKGTYSYYCGAGTTNVTERVMHVSKQGTFGARFSQPIKGPNGKVSSVAYASISGAFETGGGASISYLVDYVFPGARVKHPYSTSNPKALGCASWVRGTARAR
jgi:hypothetical protein